MNNFLMIAGFIFIILLLCIVFFGILTVMLEKFNKILANIKSDTKRITRKDVGREILQQAYWFSEDKSSMNAINLIGKSYFEDEAFNPATAREEWRNYRIKENGGVDVTALLGELATNHKAMVEAKGHIDGLRYDCGRYDEAGKEKMAICKIIPAISSASAALKSDHVN